MRHLWLDELKPALAGRPHSLSRIWLARLSSRTAACSCLIVAASSVVVPDRTPEPSGATPHPRSVSRPHDPATTAARHPCLWIIRCSPVFSRPLRGTPTGHPFPETGPPRRRTLGRDLFHEPEAHPKTAARGFLPGHRK